MVITQSYRYNTVNYVVLLQNHKSSQWRCCVKEAVHKKLHQFQWKIPVSESPFNKKLQTCSFINKRLQNRRFPVKLAKFLRTSTFKNICERLLPKFSMLQKKLFIDFFHKTMTFIIITITFEVLKFLLSFCAVFANLFYKNIRSSLLC